MKTHKIEKSKAIISNDRRVEDNPFAYYSNHEYRSTPQDYSKPVSTLYVPAEFKGIFVDVITVYGEEHIVTNDDGFYDTIASQFSQSDQIILTEEWLGLGKFSYASNAICLASEVKHSQLPENTYIQPPETMPSHLVKPFHIQKVDGVKLVDKKWHWILRGVFE